VEESGVVQGACCTNSIARAASVGGVEGASIDSTPRGLPNQDLLTRSRELWLVEATAEEDERILQILRRLVVDEVSEDDKRAVLQNGWN